ARATGYLGAGELVLHAAAIWLALLAVRFILLWGGLYLAVYRGKRRGEHWNRPSPRMAGAAAFAGIRGAVTLAGVLSVPYSLPNGFPFPARDLLTFLASGIILFSLLGGCFGLPVFLRGLRLPPDDLHDRETAEARRLAAAAAVQAIQEARDRVPTSPEPAGEAAEVLDRLSLHYRRKMEAPEQHDGHSRGNALAREVHLNVVRAERTELYRLRTAGRINDETLRALVAEIDLVEASLLGGE
ncbi:MAG TPA: hypothetical protein VGD78_08200, partial [Chthoniobacterales bacterium]